MNFQNRSEWDEHIISAKHLVLVQKNGARITPEYYDPLDVVKFLKLSSEVTEVKNEVKSDVHESERVREASALALSRVANYEVSDYDENKIVGKFCDFAILSKIAMFVENCDFYKKLRFRLLV